MKRKKLTKTQCACLISAGIYPLRVTDMCGDTVTQAKNSTDEVYGRHTLNSLITSGYLVLVDDTLRTTDDGLMELPPAVHLTVAAVRCLLMSLSKTGR